MINSISAGSNAQLAGLLSNDLITAVNGQELVTDTFEEVLNRHTGGQLTLRVLREGNEIELTANLDSSR
jgi:S1-C subfamily serine protease